ncbi:MAG: hypothetical protein ACRD5G_12545 [Candidatus Acidiferrales bacterium]
MVSKVEVEVFRPGTPTVRLFDSSGVKAREVSLWFEGPERINVNSVAVGPSGEIVVGGVAVHRDGSRVPYLARFDKTGRLTNVIQTSPFHPANVCITADGKIWSFGSAGKHAADEPLLRQFHLEKGEVAGYLPRSSFHTVREPAFMRSPGAVYFRCMANRIAIYSEVANEYIEFDPIRGVAERWELMDRVTPKDIALGFAVTASGEVFSVLQEMSEKANSALYQLHFERDTHKARWLLVEGTAGDKTTSEAIGIVLGADEDDIVFRRRHDRLAVLWARPRDRN